MKIDVKPSTSTSYRPKSPDDVPTPPTAQPDQEQIQRLKALSKRLTEELPPEVVSRKPAGATYSNLFFRALLLSAIVLIGLTIFSRPESPAVEDPDLEISTSQTAIRSESNGTNVEGPPPAVLVQPSE